MFVCVFLKISRRESKKKPRGLPHGFKETICGWSVHERPQSNGQPLALYALLFTDNLFKFKSDVH